MKKIKVSNEEEQNADSPEALKKNELKVEIELEEDLISEDEAQYRLMKIFEFLLKDEIADEIADETDMPLLVDREKMTCH